jgi:ribosomal protein L11 methyltransferase
VAKARQQLANPFRQPQQLMALRVWGEPDTLNSIEELAGESALTSALFEQTETEWMLELVFDGAEMSEAHISTRMELLKQAGLVTGRWEWQPVESRDWVSEMQAQFPPIAEGRIYLHGSHLPPRQRPFISLEIDAGQAFGTGEHATTAACLEALQYLAKTQRFSRVLDVGTGTGVLALAAKKLWQGRVIATDIDPVSVQVAKANAKRNSEPNMPVWLAEGLTHPVLSHGPNYDLIIANILARPLIQLAGAMTSRLQPGGYLVLSGLLTRQEKPVLLAYRSRGLQLHRAIRRGEWSALVLKRRLFN